MKLTSRTFPSAFRVTLLCLVVGTLAWELFERILGVFGTGLDLRVGPVGFDIRVIAISVMANPGTFLGLPVAVLLLRRL